MSPRSGYPSDVEGATAPIFAISLMAIVGLVGATLALGMDSRAAANLQSTADSAALAGATAFISTDSPRAEDRLKAASETAVAVATSNSDYYIAELSIAPYTEDAYGQHTEIDVNMAFSPANPIANVAGRNASIEIERRSVATATWGFPLCILSLSDRGTGVSTRNQAHLGAVNCIVWSNSLSHDSLDFAGGDARAKYFCAAGEARVSRGSQVIPRPHEACDPIPDPLGDWKSPNASKPEIISSLQIKDNVSRDPKKLLKELEKALDNPALKTTFKLAKKAIQSGEPLSTVDVSLITTTLEVAIATDTISTLSYKKLDENGIFTKGDAEGLTVLEVAQILGIIDNIDGSLYQDDTYFDSATMTLSPGTYAGLDIAYGHIKMMPGIYHIVDAPLIVRRRATLTGEGVTIIFHGDDATFSVLDEARLTLKGPTGGDTAGFILAEDKRDSTKQKRPYSRLTGNGAIEAIGTVYLPSHTFAIKGDGAADQTSPLLQIVADTVNLSDNGALDIVFAPEKTNVPVAIQPEREARLVY